MDIDAARDDLRTDLEPLGIPTHFGPMDKDPLVLPALVIVPARTGPWVEPGQTFTVNRYHFDLIFQCTGDDTDAAMNQIIDFVSRFSRLRSTWTHGFTVEAPYQVNAGAATWVEILIHVSNQREG
ncbi:hypothetical protein ACTOB_003045 [Actinoplanes oblitus]|uniref:Tail terminator n=1 Tax=Actinoplanes oblitus TaxID=3040509 RepID=A0ABY8WND7_9ACTN|nr:hypothetical protein [Actinoplanes oblitus]WIM99394.1 hypothetical protein ACTOB_003045 [Actinoplanes oblitus]